MSPNTLGIIIGGLIPALLFGTGNFLLKVSNAEGIGIAPLLASGGAGFIAAALCVFAFLPDTALSIRSSASAFGFGFFMGIGTALVSIAIVKYGTPLSILTPLFNMNTLVAVLLALWIYAEWKQVHIPKLLIGSVLIIIGGTFVARA